MKMYALVTRSGTAMAETALCERHVSETEDFPPAPDSGEEPWVEQYDHERGLVDCSGNEVLECQYCGTQDDYYVTEDVAS